MKSNLMMIIVLIFGVVLGAFLGDILGKYDAWAWTNYGKEIGFTEPFVLDLYILKITFAAAIKVSIGSIIGFILAAFTYKKLF